MIGFLHPWALLGLLGAAVPILLHLLARREPPTVVFPAVRYLVTTTKEHQRRLKLQNLLLLAVRTLLIVVLALAAAGPTMRVSGVPGHAPSALVLIVDNSPSSAAVVAGSARLGHLVSAARQVLGRATPDDALWLITADGVPERGDAGTLTERLRALKVSSRRLDLGAALTMAGEILAPQSRPGEIVLLSDLQASAVSPADVTHAAAGWSPRRSTATQRRARAARDRHAALVLRRRPGGGVVGRRLRGRRAGHHPNRTAPAGPGARPHRRRGGTRRARRRRGLVDGGSGPGDPTSSAWTTAGSASCGWRRWRGRPGIPAAATSPPRARCSRRIVG